MLSLPEGYAQGIRGFRDRHTHQPRGPQRLQPPRHALHAAETLHRGRAGFRYGHKVRLGIHTGTLQPCRRIFRHAAAAARTEGSEQRHSSRLDKLAGILQPRHHPFADRRLQQRPVGLRPRGRVLAQQCAGILQPRQSLHAGRRDRECRAGLHEGHIAIPRLRKRISEPQLSEVPA